MEKCAVKKCGGRVLSLDLLKLFAIYLVLYGHCVQQFLTAPAVENGVYSTIYSFHMPLFMMISGYFSASSIRLEAKEFFKKKVVGLLLPVFSWSVILFLLFCLCDYFVPGSNLGHSSLGANFDAASGSFWFLKSLFACYVLAWCGRRIGLSVVCRVLLTLLVSQLFPWWNVKVMYPCFLVGMALREYAGWVQKRANVILWVSLPVFALLFCFWDGGFLLPSNLMAALRSGDMMGVACQLFVRVYRAAIGISGSLVLFVLFDKLFGGVRECAAVSRLANCGRYTLEVYLMQAVVLEAVLGAFVCFDAVPTVLFNCLLSPLIAALVLVVLVTVARLLQRSRVLSFLLFAKRG